MQIDIVSLFPGICQGALGESISKRAVEKGLVRINYRDLREYAPGRHRVTDTPPYGGGPGMVMRVEPFYNAVGALRQEKSRVLLMSPQGRPFDQTKARALAGEEHLIFLCGHYEGVDHRVVENLVDEEISIGDYVLTNGALAAAVVTDAVVRLIPGVLGDQDSAVLDSFSETLLEGPQYTRPAEFRGWKVPDILLSGNHEAIREWRANQARERTSEVRPDLLQQPCQKKESDQ